jgi:hypothetical protein
MAQGIKSASGGRTESSVLWWERKQLDKSLEVPFHGGSRSSVCWCKYKHMWIIDMFLEHDTACSLISHLDSMHYQNYFIRRSFTSHIRLWEYNLLIQVSAVLWPITFRLLSLRIQLHWSWWVSARDACEVIQWTWEQLVLRCVMFWATITCSRTWHNCWTSFKLLLRKAILCWTFARQCEVSLN